MVHFWNVFKKGKMWEIVGWNDKKGLLKLIQFMTLFFDRSMAICRKEVQKKKADDQSIYLDEFWGFRDGKYGAFLIKNGRFLDKI